MYLDLRKGEEQLAFQEIDSYIEKHPDDETFKKDVAYDLDSYSNACYYYDAAQNASFIADKKAYEILKNQYETYICVSYNKGSKKCLVKEK